MEHTRWRGAACCAMQGLRRDEGRPGGRAVASRSPRNRGSAFATDTRARVLRSRTFGAAAARPPHIARRPGLAAVDVTADDRKLLPDDTAPSPTIEVDGNLAGAPGPARIPARDPVTTLAADRLCRLLRVLPGAEGRGKILLAVNGQHDVVVHRGPHRPAPRRPRAHPSPGQEQFQCRRPPSGMLGSYPYSSPR